MTSFLEVDAADERHTRLASRKGVVTAQQRIADQYGSFIFSQGREGLAYLKDEIEGIVVQAAEEFGTEPRAMYDSVMDYFEARIKEFETEGGVWVGDPNRDPRTAAIHESRKPKMCPFHRDVVDISLTEGSAKAGFDAMAQHWGGPRHCDGDGYEGDKCKFKPQMVTQSYWDERAEKAEERKQQRAEQAELQAQQGDEIIDSGDVINDPLDTSDTLVEEPVVEDNVVEVDFAGDQSGPEPSAEEVPMSMAANAHDAATYTVNLKGQNNFIASIPVEARDEWDARQQAIRQNVAAGNPPAWIDSVTEAPGARLATEVTGLGEAIPKMDKRLWTPESVPFLDVDDDDGHWPTKHKDIVEPIKPNNSDKLSEIGEQETEHQDVEKGADYAKTDGQGGTWTKGPNTAISSADDIHKNPITELVREGYDGFLPQAEVQQAIASHRN